MRLSTYASPYDQSPARMDLHLLTHRKQKLKKRTRMAGILISVGMAAFYAVSYFPG